MVYDLWSVERNRQEDLQYNIYSAEEKHMSYTAAVTPLFMGAESCEKSESLQTFFATFLMYALYGSKKLRKKFGNFHFRQ